MKVDVLVAEIGSTTTVVNAFHGLDGGRPVYLGQGQAPTSVLDGDVRIGLQSAVSDLCGKLGTESLEYREMLATSSAAGGLKMTVHGLVYDMTAKAAREAALGAGGILHYVTAGRLRRTDLAKIKEIRPNLILIAGGVDYGERDTAIANAEMIRSMNLKIPVVYAGNVENQEEMRLIFPEEEGEQLYIVENVYPKIDALNVEPCRKVIQDAFEQNITHAPGMEHVREMVTGPIIPTPGAVMECTKLLYEYLGDLIVLDVGGATTDLHSVTVESIGEEKLREQCREQGFSMEHALETYRAIPKTEEEVKLVELLTREAVVKAAERHAGRLRYIYGPSGRSTVAEGKDLTQVKYIVGTGGALTRLPHREEIMREITRCNESGMLLLPGEHAQILVDHDYIMASLGVLSKRYPQAAARLLEQSLGITFPARKAEEPVPVCNKELSLMIVTKGVCAYPPIVRMLTEHPGVDFLADSRIQNLKSYAAQARQAGKQTVLLRLSMPSEVSEVVEYADVSFQSELSTIRLLDEAAGRAGKRHNVVLMIDLGDLREGIFYEKEEEIFSTVAELLLLKHIRLYGLGTNLTCYGAIIPKNENLSLLVGLARKLEQRFHIRLPMVSGGNSSSIYLIEQGNLPEGINNLRLGESFLLGNDTAYGTRIPGTVGDALELEAEVIEIKEKPSLPVGEIGVDAFGHRPTYEDKGIMRRAIVAVGRQDVDTDSLQPRDPQIEILGGSSDHLLLDLTHCTTVYQVGDRIQFTLGYGSMLKAFTSPYVEKVI